MIPDIAGLGAFGPAVVAALLIAGYLVVGEPWAGAVLHRRFEAALERDRTARLWLYRRLLVLEWGLVALVAGVVVVAPDVTWGQLGLRWPDQAPGVLAVALGVAVLAFIVLSTGVVRTSARRGSQDAAGGALGSSAVVALVPRTTVERRWFGFVAVTAGWCEEILYRGFFLAVVVAIVPNASDPLLVLTSAVVFGIAHAYQGVAGVITTGVLGAVLGYLYVGTGTVLAPILVHAAIDLRILWLPRSILPPDPVPG